MCGITKPSPSAYIKKQKAFWIPTIYTFLCKCPYRTVQSCVIVNYHEMKHNSSEQTKHLRSYPSAEKSSMTKYHDLNGKSQFCKILLTNIKPFSSLNEEVTGSAGSSNVPT